MPPPEYRAVRASASRERRYHCSFVDSRPYLPNLSGSGDSTSISRAAAAVVLASRSRSRSHSRSSSSVVSSFAAARSILLDDDSTLIDRLTVSKVSGGITNALFRVAGLRAFVAHVDAEAKVADTKAEAEAEAEAESDAGSDGGGNGNSNEDGDEEKKLEEDEEVDDSVLVRVFGAEGMIDRDVETSTYASLCDAGIAGRYLGRFSDGRVEGWLDGFTTLTKSDFADPAKSDAIAAQAARLHRTFVLPEHLRDYHDPSRPAMWTQLHSWMDQAKSYDNFRTADDDRRAAKLDLDRISAELAYLETEVVPADAGVAFCHNDLLAANVMSCPRTGDIQLIDFEYGGVNYVSFDIANHFNEHAGGTDEEDNGVPDYGLFPTETRQEEFVRAYVKAAREAEGQGQAQGSGSGSGSSSSSSSGENGSIGQEEVEQKERQTEEEEVRSLLKEVHAFILPNHLYWGLWAVNQAAMEGCEGFDYLTYAKARFDEFYRAKEKVVGEIEKKK